MRTVLCSILLGLAGLIVGADAILTAQEQERVSQGSTTNQSRVTAGLVALYDFASDNGSVVRDRSGAGTPLDLHISDPEHVKRSPGQLEVTGKTIIRSQQPPQRLIRALRQSGELTLEAWIRPSDKTQSGPARIVTLSNGTSHRNLTLGQEGTTFDVRLRSTKASENGLPSLSSRNDVVQTELMHVVYTRDRAGHCRLFLDGKPQQQELVGGSLENWSDTFELALANETSGDRPWVGTYHLVAMYKRALAPQEVMQNFRLGPRASENQIAGVPAASSQRTDAALLALYDFALDSGPIIEDRSGIKPPIQLQIADSKEVRRSAGELQVVGDAVIRTASPPKRLIEAVRRSGEITIEAWVRPATTDQQGPARIVTLSKDANQRNFTLGQDGDKYDVRFRTSKTSTNGLPSLSTQGQSLKPRLSHIVYTRNRVGRARIYLDGKPVANARVDGDLSNWQPDFTLALANEINGSRPWKGTYHLVAIYGRDLSAQEVRRHYEAGPDRARSGPQLASDTADPHETFFRDHVAPILAQHCLECHDTAVKEGGLDLSRHTGLLAGSENGKIITVGNAGMSRLWETVKDDEMPLDRPPLSEDEKKALRTWIDEGAVWSGDVIDPALYAHGSHRRENWLRRLTLAEYITTVQSAVGVDISVEARELLPRDLRADGFSNTAYNLGVDLKHVESYAQLAEIIVGRMDVKEFASRFSKQHRLIDDDMRGLIEKMGKWILRGPLSEEEIVSYRGISTTVASAGGNFNEAVGYVLQAMLQTPRFLYRVENQIGDGGAWPVSDYELASRLSYLIWGGPPDEQLLQLADEGTLADRTVVSEQVMRMLEDPQAMAHSREFVTQWLNLRGLDNLSPDRDRFPNWDPQLATDMREETLRFFEDVIWRQRRPMSDLLNAQVTFLTPRLATHYGLRPNADGSSMYDLKLIPGRGGLLTQGSVLTIGGDNASMVSRGLFVMHDLLRGAVKDPPPCVDTTPTPTRAGLTQRAIAEARIADSSCGGCHAKFEPLAFGLEKFDGLGTYLETDEHGNALRDDGNILFPGTADPVPYDSSAELMDLLAASERVQESLTWKLTQFCLGRPLAAADAPVVAKMHESARQAGGTYADILTAIAMSEFVQTTLTEASP